MVADTIILYLASKSASRRQLLQDAQIPFEVIGQDADETACDWAAPVAEIVQSIARQKMEHACVPSNFRENDCCIVVTADTLVQNCVTGKVFGKPTGYDDAVATLKELGQGVHVVTAFCCEKKRWKDGQWVTIQLIEKIVSGDIVLDIPDTWIPMYLEKHPCALDTAGVLFVEGHGAQFVKTVHGSYTAVLGLPMCELRLALEELGFFKSSLSA
jgi:septum formation protein